MCATLAPWLGGRAWHIPPFRSAAVPRVGVGRRVVVRAAVAPDVHAVPPQVDAGRRSGRDRPVDAAPAEAALVGVHEHALVRREVVGVLAGQVHVDAHRRLRRGCGSDADAASESEAQGPGAGEHAKLGLTHVITAPR